MQMPRVILYTQPKQSRHLATDTIRLQLLATTQFLFSPSNFPNNYIPYTIQTFLALPEYLQIPEYDSCYCFCVKQIDNFWNSGKRC